MWSNRSPPNLPSNPPGVPPPLPPNTRHLHLTPEERRQIYEEESIRRLAIAHNADLTVGAVLSAALRWIVKGLLVIFAIGMLLNVVVITIASIIAAR